MQWYAFKIRRYNDPLFGVLHSPRLPAARCPSCETVIGGNRIWNHSLPTTAPNLANRPIALDSFLVLREKIEAVLALPYRLYPQDRFLPLDWSVDAPPDLHLFGVMGGVVCSPEFREAWLTAELTGASFLPIEGSQHFVFRIDYRIAEPFDATPCHDCRTAIGADDPEHYLTSMLSSLPDILSFATHLVSERCHQAIAPMLGRDRFKVFDCRKLPRIDSKRWHWIQILQ